MAFYVLRLGPPIIATLVYIALAAFLLRWDYRRSGEPVPPVGPLLYSVFRQLFFEPVEAFPTTTIARVVVLLTPIMSVVLIAQGIIKVAASFLDPESRREVWTTIMAVILM